MDLTARAPQLLLCLTSRNLAASSHSCYQQPTIFVGTCCVFVKSLQESQRIATLRTLPVKLEVVCSDGRAAVFPTLSLFSWERWLKPFGAEVVSSLLITAEVLLLLWPGVGTFWCMSLFWQPEPDIFLATFFDWDCLGGGNGFLAEAVVNCVAHGPMCCGGIVTNSIRSC